MTSRHYVHLGKLLCAEFPDIAQQLNEKINEDSPTFSDLSLLPAILNFYCQNESISPEMVKGEEMGRNAQDKTDRKHVFVAVVVKLYSPATLGPTKEILMNKLRQELSTLLITRGDRISRIISNVRLHLRVYKDFLNQVEQNYSAIKLNAHEIKNSKKS